MSSNSLESLELENAYFESIKELKEGDIVKGRIIALSGREVIIDVGYKSEGIILREEFVDVENLEELKDIEVYVENVEDEDGKIILSYRKAQELKGWDKLLNEYKEGDLVEGIVIKRVKGGYIVSVFGIEGFLPQSLSTFRGRTEKVLGTKFYFQVIKLSKAKSNLILSRKDAFRLEKEIAKQKLWDTLKVGEIKKGRVKSITNFGAFIDLGKVDGLLHIADMSWKKISHPTEMVAVGDEINVVVLGFDREKGKISLGLKQTMPDPWIDIEAKYPSSSTIKGKIVNIQNYGVFVELEKGIEGLVHISEVSWTKKFINLNEMFAIGDIVEVQVIKVDAKARKISLSIKQIEKDPWEEIENIVALDSEVKGKVVSFGEGCVYIEIENSLDGIIYNNDLSWTRRILKAAEVLKKQHVYDLKVLGLDRDNRRVILGKRQIVSDPWPQILKNYPIGKIIETEVVKITNFGVFVKLEEDLEGLVFSGEIDKEMIEALKPMDKLRVKIIKMDPASIKIGLSARLDEKEDS